MFEIAGHWLVPGYPRVVATVKPGLAAFTSSLHRVGRVQTDQTGVHKAGEMLLDIETYWETLGYAAGLGISCFVLIGLIWRLRETSERRMFLWAMLAFFAINCLDLWDSLAYGAASFGPMTLYQWQHLLLPGFMVSLYFFVRGLTSSEPKLSVRDLVHVLPFLGGFFCLLPSLLLPGAQRAGFAKITVSEAHQTWIAYGEVAFWGMWIIVLVLYGGACVRRLLRHKHNVRELFSDLEGKNLRWLDGLVATILTLALIVIVDESRMLAGHAGFLTGVKSASFDVVLSGVFGVFALRAVPPLPQWSKEVLPNPSLKEPPQQGQDNRYARSGLQAEDLDRFAKRLETRVAEGQLWRDHGLNLRRLAQEVSVSSVHLSEVLNTQLGMTFYDYINQCRVRDACALLVDTNLTILEISETVGFNAKSTFNASFKKVTDQTPSQWRKSNQP